MTLFYVVLSFCLLNCTWGYKSYKDYRVYDVKGSEKAIWDFSQSIESHHSDIIFEPRSRWSGEALIAPQSLKKFFKAADENNVKVDLVFSDFSLVIASERKTGVPISSKAEPSYSWDKYYDVDGTYEYLKNVSRLFPDAAELVVGGKSYEGRDILGLRVHTPVAGEKETGKPVIFIESGIHAREWITPASTTYFINELLTSEDSAVRAMKESFDWRIFPTINPDGYQYTFEKDRMWRKTRSQSPNGCIGTDPNRNWDYNWGKHGVTHNPCDYQVYCGSEPFSEVETKTLSKYIASIENLQAYIAFHSNAKMLLMPYSDSITHEDNYDEMKQLGRSMLKYVYAVNNETYEGPATAAEILYKASGGSMDWVKYALRTPIVFTLELRGRSFVWPPERIPEQARELVAALKALTVRAQTMGYW